MPYLALDTSTDHLSLALATDSGIRVRDWHVGQKHAELTLPCVAELLNECGVTLDQLAGIVFAAGPGSFTGLRIGCGIAQGLAFSRDLPVLGISTLEALAEASGHDRVYCCLDARMNQVYAAAYDRTESGWQEHCAPVVCNPEDVPLPDSDGWFGCGSGFRVFPDALAARLAPHLNGSDATLAATAGSMLALALPRFAAGKGLPAAEAQLVYLRDKVALKTSERG